MKKLSVVVPMYNETNIYSNMQEMIKSLDKNFKNYEIILVDDGSTNDCFKQAKKIKSKKLKVAPFSNSNWSQ